MSPGYWSIAPRYAGTEQCSPGHGWSGVRDHFLMHLVISGHGEVNGGGRRVQAQRGDVFLLEPNAHMDYRASLAEPWLYMWAGFGGMAAREACRQTGATRSNPVVTLRGGHRVEHLMGELIESLRRRAPGFLWRAAGLLNIVLAEIAEFGADRPSRTPAYRTDTAALVEQARSFIDENYNRYIEVADVAAYIGLDRSYLGRRFKEITGATLQQSLERRRMERAIVLIRGTSLPFSHVASSVGYRSYEVFERAYRRTFHVSPGETRARSGSPGPDLT